MMFASHEKCEQLLVQTGHFILSVLDAAEFRDYLISQSILIAM